MSKAGSGKQREGGQGVPAQFDLFDVKIDVEAPAPHEPVVQAEVSASLPPPLLDAPALLEELQRWSEAGWLRRLDAAFARFLWTLDPAAEPAVLLVAAIAAHVEGRGDSCLDVQALEENAAEVLAWRPEAMAAWDALRARLLEAQGAAGWTHALQASRLAATADADEDEARPLVLAGCRLYLRRYWNHERAVARQVALRVQSMHEESGPEADRGEIRTWLDRLFGARAEGRQGADADTAADAGMETDWQRIACAVALRGRLAIVTGGPGTGKTYTAARLLALLFAVSSDPAGLRVALAAPTGKAAARLKQSIDAALEDLQGRLGPELGFEGLAQQIGPARTLHSLLGARGDTRFFRHDERHPLEMDVLLVDEASMVHLEMMDALLRALPPHARLILLGDKDQLASVEAGAVLGDLCRHADDAPVDDALRRYVEEATGERLPRPSASAGTAPSLPGTIAALARQTVTLRASRRFGGPIGRLAAAVREGNVEAALAVLRERGQPELQWVAGTTPEAVIARTHEGYKDYLALAAQRRSRLARGDALHEQEDAQAIRAILAAFERLRVLCAVREGEYGVQALNLGMARALRSRGLLPGSGEWYEGRPVLVTRNDPAAGVFNGDVGIALRAASSGSLRVWFAEGSAVRSVMASRLADVETAFAMTVHKSQGSEFEHTVLVLPPESSRVTGRELVYTGITRARTAFTLVTPRPEAFAEAVLHPTLRASGLLERLGEE